MKIASAQLQLSAQHEAHQEHQVSSSLRVWATPTQAEPARPQVSLSEQGLKQLQSENSQQVDATDDSLVSDALLFLRTIVEMMTGRRIKLIDSKDLSPSEAPSIEPAASGPQQAPPSRNSAGFGLAYDYQESYRETERMQFSASGQVSTADGKTISFNLNLEMARSYSESTSLSLRAGDAPLKDPLILNFGGTAAQLSDTRFNFDLDGDGTQENLRFVAPGSGFLVFDKNGDGVANDGSELFGASTGNGFAELAQLDEDGNGWIDENDGAFTQLRVWEMSPDGTSQMRSLLEANVGAISLAHVNTPFSIKNENNELEAQVKASGIFLQETGGAGTIQQLDLKV